MKIILMSDLHQIAGGELYGVDPKRRLQAAIDDINREHADAEAVVLLGDITDLGDAAAYGVAAERLQGLVPPVYLIPGNHDDRREMRVAFPDLPDTPFLQQTVELSAATFLLLDTVTENGGVGGEHWGDYCEVRGEWLKSALIRARKDRPVILCQHHPSLDIGTPADTIRLLNTEHLRRAILESGRTVSLICCGHVHSNVGGVWNGIPMVAIRALVHQSELVLRSDVPLAYTHGQPAYGILLVNGEDLVFHYHSYLDNARVAEY